MQWLIFLLFQKKNIDKRYLFNAFILFFILIN